MEDLAPPFNTCSLHQKQQYYFNGYYCFYCRKACEYIDSIEVYQQPWGMIFICRPCKAWVNCHNNTDQAFGFVAKKDLRDIRHNAHQIFDPLWQKKIEFGYARKFAQAAGRKWLSKELGISIVECHIGMFTSEQCQKVIELCIPFHK